MNSPNKARLRMWARALKSGQYEQGVGYMRTEDGKYCCLGVAMDLAIANGCQVTGNVNWGKTSSMPLAIANWYGLVPSSGDGIELGNAKLKNPNDSGNNRRAANLNDCKVPFAQIADWVTYTFDLNSDEES